MTKLYKRKDSKLEHLNINFCVNLLRHTTLKRVITETISKFKNLTQLDAFNISSSNSTLDLNDLQNLFETCPKLKNLSFNLSLNLDSLNQKLSKTFDKLESLKVEFKSSSSRILLQLIIKNCFNLKKLELYYDNGQSKNVLDLSERIFPFKKLTKLKHLITGTDNLTFNLNNSLLDLIHVLDTFSINISINKTDEALFNLINLDKIDRFDLNFGIDINFLRMNNIVLNTNPFNLSDVVKNYFDLNFNNKLNSIKLYISMWPCILPNIDLNLSNAKFLKKIDFSSIHIHSTKSICNFLSILCGK